MATKIDSHLIVCEHFSNGVINILAQWDNNFVKNSAIAWTKCTVRLFCYWHIGTLELWHNLCPIVIGGWLRFMPFSKGKLVKFWLCTSHANIWCCFYFFGLLYFLPNAVQWYHNVVNFLQNPNKRPHSSPVRVSCMDSNFNQYSDSITALIILCWTMLSQHQTVSHNTGTWRHWYPNHFVLLFSYNSLWMNVYALGPSVYDFRVSRYVHNVQ